MLINNKKNKEGFTLVELMVATTLFTVIMLMGIGSLITSSNSAKSSQKLRTAVDNVNFAMESMTRELRVGTHYHCSFDLANSVAVSSCPDGQGSSAITFTPQNAGPTDRVSYGRNQTNALVRCESKGGVVSCNEIVSPDINIELLKFYVDGSILDDDKQPNVKILIKGVATVKEVPTPFFLQTMASQRSSE